MENLKFKISRLRSPSALADGGQVNPKSNQGFTLMELIVVVAIMSVLAGAMVLNLAGQRSNRDLKLAQSQLVSNLRKIQSYTLSSRLLPSGQTAQYYAMKFNTSTPDRYTIQAMSNISSSPQRLQDLETIKLPVNIIISQVVISSRPNSPTTQYLTNSCGLAVFSAPFGKIFFNDGCLVSDPNNLQTGDDYKKIIDFVSNIACVSVPPPSYSPTVCSVSTDSIMTITLADKLKLSSTKTVTVNGITGAVTFN